MTTNLTRSRVARLLTAAGLNAAVELTGAGRNWEIEIPAAKDGTIPVQNDTLLERVQVALGTPVGGYTTGYHAWILTPNYTDAGDWNNPSSRCHY